MFHFGCRRINKTRFNGMHAIIMEGGVVVKDESTDIDNQACFSLNLNRMEWSKL